MNIIEYAKLKKLFGSKGGDSGATVCNVSEFDELPSKAPAGSIGIVYNTGIIGNWALRNVLNPDAFQATFSFDVVNPNGEKEGCYNFYSNTRDGEFILYYSPITSPTGMEIEAYNTSNAYGWSNLGYRYIGIYDHPGDTLEAWIRDNGDKMKSIYLMENGEWVYLGEMISFGESEPVSQGSWAHKRDTVEN